MGAKVCLLNLLPKDSYKCVDVKEENDRSVNELNIALEKALNFIAETEKLKIRLRKKSEQISSGNNIS